MRYVHDPTSGISSKTRQAKTTGMQPQDGD